MHNYTQFDTKSFASLAIVRAFIIVNGMRNIDATINIALAPTGKPKVESTRVVPQGILEGDDVVPFVATPDPVAVWVIGDKL